LGKDTLCLKVRPPDTIEAKFNKGISPDTVKGSLRGAKPLFLKHFPLPLSKGGGSRGRVISI